MNKYSVLICFLTIFVSFSAYGQKESQKTNKPTKSGATLSDLKNETDSLSYAFGVTITEGLPQYLIQTGVLIDTATISANYLSKIQNETDAIKKNNLQKEMQSKIDSAQTANIATIEGVLDGFNKTFLAAKSEAGYNTGVSIATQMLGVATNFSTQILGGKEINKELFASAFTSTLNNDKPLITNPQDFIQQKAAQAQEKAQLVDEENLKIEYASQIKEGEQFMAENKTKIGVVELPSGLQYKVLKNGTGPTPKMGDNVKVHYHATLLDGTVFDSSKNRGEPNVFQIGQLIAGWNEALTMMPVGSTWMLYIPYNLAYGAQGAGQQIKPFSDLIFAVELISIEK